LAGFGGHAVIPSFLFFSFKDLQSKSSFPLHLLYRSCSECQINPTCLDLLLTERVQLRHACTDI
jgi:hypothetical protein